MNIINVFYKKALIANRNLRLILPITRINIVGWSRGAAGANLLANKIYDLQKNLTPNNVP